jgi:hypothetical protein
MPLSIEQSMDEAFPTPGLSLTFQREALQSISGHDTLGRLGRGWSDNLAYHLSTNAEGDVAIAAGPTVCYFDKQADGSNMPGMGDEAKLT